MTDAVNPYRRLSPRADESDLVNFGSVPGTRAEDGDPLDVLVILESPSFAGCLVTARLIGGLHVEQFEKRRKVRNDRLIAMPETAVNKPDIRSLQQLGRSRRGAVQCAPRKHTAQRGHQSPSQVGRVSHLSSNKRAIGGVQQAIVGKCDEALDSLSGRAVSPEDVHTARKALKESSKNGRTMLTNWQTTWATITISGCCAKRPRRRAMTSRTRRISMRCSH